jgi:hypothetical protein
LRKQILIVTLFVLALRLPFLNQPIQGDDVFYLYGAEHALIDPLHPTHVRYAFLGQMVDMRGHPHPPFDVWYLGALLAIVGQVSEVPFHAAFIPFSLLAGWSALWLARRFSRRPLAVTMLFLAAPAFVINGTSLETDLPFTAFWLASVAIFVKAVDRRSARWLSAFALAMTLAIFTAYQAIVLVPILLLYGRKWKPACTALFVAPAIVVLWQACEKATSGALPAAMLTGYMQTYGLQAWTPKIRNAAALTGHLAWLVFPVLPIVALRPSRWWLYAIVALAMDGASFVDGNPLFWWSVGVGVLILLWCIENRSDFLAQWILIFFAAALIVFFAGSARYLLPIALPVAMIVADRSKTAWLYSGIGLGLALSLLLAIENYQVWDGYRQFARTLRHDAETRRVWVNGEWGVRFYLESAGALPYLVGQDLRPGDMVVSSDYGATLPSGALATVAERTITPSIPLRLFSKTSRSAYSTTSFGLRPFDISTQPVDVLRAQAVVERKPQFESITMNSPASGQQIVSGVYEIENGQFRWMSGKAVLLLKPPPQPTPLEVRFFIPDQAPARHVTVLAGDTEVASQTYPAPGAYTLTTKPASDGAITILVDKTFSVPGDRRELGIVLSQIGFTPATSGKSAQTGNR